jgi:Rrf2 family protein
MKISQKGLYALQSMMTLGREYQHGTLKVREIAADSDLPGKFLELILVELKNARLVESVRGAKGGYKLRRAPSEIRLSEIIRLIDGPLAPFGNPEELRSLILLDAHHRGLYQAFLEVRDAAASILENTTLADIVERSECHTVLTKKARAGRRQLSGRVPLGPGRAVTDSAKSRALSSNQGR